AGHSTEAPLVLQIPPRDVGRVIGVSGANVHAIEKASDTRIAVKSPSAEVHVEGKGMAVHKAYAMLAAVVNGAASGDAISPCSCEPAARSCDGGPGSERDPDAAAPLRQQGAARGLRLDPALGLAPGEPAGREALLSCGARFAYVSDSSGAVSEYLFLGRAPGCWAWITWSTDAAGSEFVWDIVGAASLAGLDGIQVLADTSVTSNIDGAT
ncbi:unnamed protein product, partial [Prorocentrum cordatum]